MLFSSVSFQFVPKMNMSRMEHRLNILSNKHLDVCDIMLCRGNGCAHIIHSSCGNIAVVIESTIPHTYNKRKSKHGNGWVANTMTRRARTKGKEETALVQEERGGDS